MKFVTTSKRGASMVVVAIILLLINIIRGGGATPWRNALYANKRCVNCQISRFGMAQFGDYALVGQCHWYGSSPFCEGTEDDCLSRGMVLAYTAETSDSGARCWTGVKVCCKKAVLVRPRIPV